MAQYAWVLGVRPGYEEEYKRRHDDIWPEMVEALRSAGVSNYSIFRHGLTLFGYFETDDLKKTQACLASADVGSCAHNPYFRRIDLSLTNFRYEALFLWGNHANLRGPAYPGAVEDPVDRSMPEAAVIVAAASSIVTGCLPLAGTLSRLGTSTLAFLRKRRNVEVGEQTLHTNKAAIPCAIAKGGGKGSRWWGRFLLS